MELKDLKLVNQGNHLSMYRASYGLADGAEKEYEFVSRAGSRRSEKPVLDAKSFTNPAKTPDGVIIFALNQDRTKVLLMREFRPATGRVIYNHPMGLIDPGESWTDAARRELKEETGLDVLKFVRILPPAFSAPGLSDRMTVMAVVEAGGDIRPGENPAEPTEPFWADRVEIPGILENPGNQFSAITQATLFLWYAMRYAKN